MAVISLCRLYIGNRLPVSKENKILECKKMAQKIDLLHDSTKKLLLKYLVPSVSATLVTSIYVLADSIIIGKGIGASGIAALNLILPCFSVIFGLGMLFGVGGAVHMSIANGGGNRDAANRYFSLAVLAAAVVSCLIAIFGTMFFRQIAYFLGADSKSYQLVEDYGKWIFYFAPVFVFSSFLQVFVRNDRDPKRAMAAVITGGVSNVVLDLLFIYKFKMGMAGGAIATVMGSSITVIILLTHFLSKSNSMRLCWKGLSADIMGNIAKCGVPSFLIDSANGVVIFVFNLQLLRYIGEVGVVVYSIISNSSIIAISLFNGVAQAAQPIVATNFGATQLERVKEIRHMSSRFSLLLGVLLFSCGLLFPGTIIDIFVNADETIYALGTVAIRIYFAAFLFTGLNVLRSNYFQAVVKPYYALVLALMRGLVLSTSLAFLFPAVFGTGALWYVIPVCEGLTFLMGSFFLKREGL